MTRQRKPPVVPIPISAMPWLQLAEETNAHYKAFRHYMQQGPTRTLAAVEAADLGSRGSISEWSRCFQWGFRADQYDQYLRDNRDIQEQRDAELQNKRVDQLQANLLQLTELEVAERLRKAQERPGEVPLGELNKLLLNLAKLRRDPVMRPAERSTTRKLVRHEICDANGKALAVLEPTIAQDAPADEGGINAQGDAVDSATEAMDATDEHPE